MPTYTYRCAAGHERDEVRRIADRNRPATCSCGLTAERGLEAPKGFSDFEPYYDDQLTEGVWVKSKAHRRELMREHGVVEGYGKGWM